MDASLKFDANLGWLFTELSFERRFEAAAKAGFRGVEYAVPYDYPAKTLSELLQANGLKQILINSPTGPAGSEVERGFGCVPGYAKQFRDGVKLGLEYAQELGAEFLHVLAGVRPADVSHHQAYAQLVANVAWAVDEATGTGVRLVLEAQNHQDCPRYGLQTQDEAAAIVAAIDSSQLGILLDFYHTQITEGNLINTFLTHRDQIFHLQLGDVPGRHEPGTGEIGWRNLFTAIAQSGYSGWLGCEYQPLSETQSGLGWLGSDFVV